MLLNIGLQACGYHTFPLLGFMSSTEMVSDTLLPPWVVFALWGSFPAVDLPRLTWCGEARSVTSASIPLLDIVLEDP